MQWTNTRNRFGIVAILLHWVMALLIIGMLALGIYMTRIGISEKKLMLFGWHKECGILVLMLVTLRIIWRLANIVPSLDNLKPIERLAARSVHLAFYGFMVILPLTGWMMTSAAGLPPSFFGWFTLPSLLAPNKHLLEILEEVHEWIAYGLIAVIGLHVLAALKHFFIDKDDILQRMLKP